MPVKWRDVEQGSRADSNSDSERRFGLGAALQSESGPRNAPVKNLSLPFLRFPLCLSPHSLPCLAWKRPTEHSFRAVFATVHYFAAIHTFPEALADRARVGVQGRGSGRRPPPHDSPCARVGVGWGARFDTQIRACARFRGEIGQRQRRDGADTAKAGACR